MQKQVGQVVKYKLGVMHNGNTSRQGNGQRLIRFGYGGKCPSFDFTRSDYLHTEATSTYSLGSATGINISAPSDKASGGRKSNACRYYKWKF